MESVEGYENTARYQKCVDISKRVRWTIDEVIQGRSFDLSDAFLPDGLSRLEKITFLTPDERRLMSQIQGRTYAYLFGLVERAINAKMMEVGRDHALGNQVAVEALLRFCEEEMKHQRLFNLVEDMIGKVLPAGYIKTADADAVAAQVLSKPNWSVLALICHVELFTQKHYKESIEPSKALSPLFKDIFLFHWREECQHAVLDELEWVREHNKLSSAQLDEAVQGFVELVGAVDQMVQAQSSADVDYFCKNIARDLMPEEIAQLKAATFAAYRWQYIVSGAEHAKFLELLGGMVSQTHLALISNALAPIVDSVRKH